MEYPQNSTSGLPSATTQQSRHSQTVSAINQKKGFLFSNPFYAIFGFGGVTFSLLYSEGHFQVYDPPPGSGTSPPSNLLYDQATTVNSHRRRENNTSLILKLLFAMVGCWEDCSSRS